MSREDLQELVLNRLGKQQHWLASQKPQAGEPVEEFLMHQVLVDLYDEAYIRLSKMLKTPLGLDVPCADRPAALIELRADELSQITSRYVKMAAPGDTLLLCDDGDTFQALLKSRVEDRCRELYYSESKL